jgi:hypothetical protein
VSTLTTARSLPERAPEVGELVQVRSRRWLVEEVVPPSAPNQSSLMKLACADDDAQGQSLNVFRDYEIDRAILKEEGWPRLPGHCHSSARQATRSSESGKASSSSNVRRRGGSAAGPTGASPGSVPPICCCPSQCKLALRDEAFYQGLRDLGLFPPPEHHSGPQVLGTDDEMRNVLSEFVDRKGDVIFVGAPGTGGRPVPKVTS